MGCFSQFMSFLRSCGRRFRNSKRKIRPVCTTEVVDVKQEHVQHSDTRAITKHQFALDRYCLPGVPLLGEELSQQVEPCDSSSVPVVRSRDGFNKTYSELCHLAEGGYGNVFAAIRKDDGLKVAVKHIPSHKVLRLPPDMSGQSYQSPLEVHLMQLAASGEPQPKGIIQLLDWYDLADELILVMERPAVCIDLFSFIQERGGHVQEHKARDIMKQLVQAVLHVHRRGVLHRDIKPENILIEMGCEPLRVRLIDFGCACVQHGGAYYKNYVGPEHTPPEWFLTSMYHAEPLTAWQLGIVLFKMTCGVNPFLSPDEVVNVPLSFRRGLSKECCDLLKRCLAKHPSERATLEEIVQHPFLVKNTI